MQSKLTIGETVPSTAKNSRAQYRVFVSCNRCGGEHEMGISVVVENGPSDKQRISDLYNGKTLPKSLADLTNKSVSCPQTGRQSTQKNNHQIFLVPTKS
jgi:hypothetical protein